MHTCLHVCVHACVHAYTHPCRQAGRQTKRQTDHEELCSCSFMKVTGLSLVSPRPDHGGRIWWPLSLVFCLGIRHHGSLRLRIQNAQYRGWFMGSPSVGGLSYILNSLSLSHLPWQMIPAFKPGDGHQRVITPNGWNLHIWHRMQPCCKGGAFKRFKRLMRADVTKSKMNSLECVWMAPNLPSPRQRGCPCRRRLSLAQSWEIKAFFKIHRM